MKKLFFLSIIALLFACGEKRTSFSAFKDAQDYTVPLFKINSVNKTALFVFPHPDDEIVCAGAMHQLQAQGWKIVLLTLTKGTEKDQRSKEWKDAVEKMAISSAELLDFPNNSWDNVVQDKIVFWYDHTDSIEKVIERKMLECKPSLLFTYDTAFGGYGHPEHRLTALSACKVFNRHRNDSAYAPEKILQITLPEKMEQLMLGKLESYALSRNRTGNTTLPDPTVSFDISKDWPFKKSAAGCYVTQINTLKKFQLIPEDTDTSEHYITFDREYYFEINK